MKLAVFTRLDLKTLELRRAGDRYKDEIRNVAALFDGNGAIVAAKARRAGGAAFARYRYGEDARRAGGAGANPEPACRALPREVLPGILPGTAGLFRGCRSGGALPPVSSVAEYMASVAELSRMAESESGRIRLALDPEDRREKTIRALTLLGWSVRQSASDGGFAIEPGDAPEDSARQEAGAALGIDQIAMIDALAGRESYAVAIPDEEAQSIQAGLWKKLAGTLPPGGFAELFARPPELAEAYAGLAAMNLDAANAVISAFGLRTLVEKYRRVVRRFGESFAVSDGSVVVPGGGEARSLWGSYGDRLRNR